MAIARHDPIIVDSPLAQWMSDKADSSPALFPNMSGCSYREKYVLIAQYLDKNVHVHVTHGATVADIQDQLKKTQTDAASAELEILYLNDHGKAHVEQVISRASDLICDCAVRLTPYEAYLLLLAVHFHDVGNMLGRRQHERKCVEIMSESTISALLGDSTEKRVIASIAAAHGGSVPCNNTNRDTIGQLSETVDLFGFPVRQRLLASILRFADELADDRSRAARFLLAENVVPVPSLLYHAYSFALQSVRIHDQEIRLSYEVSRSSLLQIYKQKKGTEVYLLDEIDSRIRKMHKERVYCMRFWPQSAKRIRQIHVLIEVVEDAGSLCLESLTCALSDSGYPGPVDGDCSLCLPPRLFSSGKEMCAKYSPEIQPGAPHA